MNLIPENIGGWVSLWTWIINLFNTVGQQYLVFDCTAGDPAWSEATSVAKTLLLRLASSWVLCRGHYLLFVNIEVGHPPFGNNMK